MHRLTATVVSSGADIKLSNLNAAKLLLTVETSANFFWSCKMAEGPVLPRVEVRFKDVSYSVFQTKSQVCLRNQCTRLPATQFRTYVHQAQLPVTHPRARDMLGRGT